MEWGHPLPIISGLVAIMMLFFVMVLSGHEHHNAAVTRARSVFLTGSAVLTMVFAATVIYRLLADIIFHAHLYGLGH